MMLYVLLFFFVSLALSLSEVLPADSRSDALGAVDGTDVSESNIDFIKRESSRKHNGFCRNQGDCGKGLFCFVSFCIVGGPENRLCRGNAMCGDGVCLNGVCYAPRIDKDGNIEAPAIDDPACRNDAQCDGGYCVSGICLADPPSKMRFIRRSPQLVCHNDRECDGGYCYNGICVADPPRSSLEARSPQLICHNNSECDGGYCYNGICVAGPPKLESRSPQLICHNNRECDGGYCYHGICVADPPRSRLLRSKP